MYLVTDLDAARGRVYVHSERAESGNCITWPISDLRSGWFLEVKITSTSYRHPCVVSKKPIADGYKSPSPRAQDHT